MLNSPSFQFGIFPILLILGAAQSGVLILTLIFKSNRHRLSNFFLIAILLMINIRLLTGICLYSDLILKYPHVYGSTFFLNFLIAPTYYFYARTLLTNEFQWQRSYWLHLIPTFWILEKAVPFLFLWGAENKLKYIHYLRSSSSIPIDWSSFFMMLVFGIQMTVYLYFTLKFTRAEENYIKDNITNNLAVISIQWLKRFTYSLMIFMGMYTILLVVLKIINTYWYEFDYLIILCQSIFVYAVVYLVIQQPEIFTDPASDLPQLNAAPEIPEPKYQTSALDDNASQKLLQKLIHTMEQEKPYLNSELKLSDLARKISVPLHQLSQVINQELNQHFFDFINQYRVNEAKQMLSDPKCDQLTILAIALDAGFNSKAAFNRAFKKYTQMTPSEFRRSPQF